MKITKLVTLIFVSVVLVFAVGFSIGKFQPKEPQPPYCYFQTAAPEDFDLLVFFDNQFNDFPVPMRARLHDNVWYQFFPANDVEPNDRIYPINFRFVCFSFLPVAPPKKAGK